MNKKEVNTAFISYARQDEEIAKSVNTMLHRAGIMTFFNIDDLTLGLEVASVINTAIHNCCIVIAIISESSYNSQWCRKELEVARDNNKPIIGIYNNLGYSSIPSFLQGCNMIAYDNLSNHPEELIRIIRDVIDEEGCSASGDTTPSIPPMASEHSDGYAEERMSYKNNKEIRTKQKKGKKKWLNWMLAVFVFLILNTIMWPGSRTESDTSNSPSITQTLSPTILWLFILILFIATIVLIILLVVSKRKIKRLNTNLDIFSDVKILAQLHGNEMIIDKEKVIPVHLSVGKQQMNLNYSTFNRPKQINCFIAGSTALQAERDALRATISLVCNRWKEKNFQIFSFTFEDFERKFAPNGQQSLYDYFIENEANVAIFLIKGEVGNFTITEFEKAYKSFKTSKHPSIIVYYDRSSELSPSAIELKNRVHLIGQYWIDYNTLNEMKYHFQEVLSTDLWTLYEKELSVK